VYFTKGWHYGDSFGVIELGNVDPRTEPALETLRADIQRMKQERSDTALKRRLDSADVVVAGRVTAVRPSTVPRLPTEHDPEWREAEIAVQTVLKGAQVPTTLRVLFVGTDDPMWIGSPKLTEGMDAIYLLHRRVETRQDLPYPAVTKPLDVLPRADEQRVRNLLR
jgi:hypothetical protein